MRSGLLSAFPDRAAPAGHVWCHLSKRRKPARCRSGEGARAARSARRSSMVAPVSPVTRLRRLSPDARHGGLVLQDPAAARVGDARLQHDTLNLGGARDVGAQSQRCRPQARARRSSSVDGCIGPPVRRAGRRRRSRGGPRSAARRWQGRLRLAGKAARGRGHGSARRWGPQVAGCPVAARRRRPRGHGRSTSTAVSGRAGWKQLSFTAANGRNGDELAQHDQVFQFDLTAVFPLQDMVDLGHHDGEWLQPGKAYLRSRAATARRSPSGMV